MAQRDGIERKGEKKINKRRKKTKSNLSDWTTLIWFDIEETELFKEKKSKSSVVGCESANSMYFFFFIRFKWMMICQRMMMSQFCLQLSH